jgi:hypothetical protein
VSDPGRQGDALAHQVRLHVFGETAASGVVPQAPAIARALGRDEAEIRAALRQLADGKVLILAPNNTEVWAANPFCAVPSGIRITTADRRYWAICVWDALGVAAALGADAVIDTPCGDCGDGMRLEVQGGRLASGEGSCTSPCRPGAGGTISASRERPCCSSGMKSMWTAGAPSAICRAAVS